MKVIEIPNHAGYFACEDGTIIGKRGKPISGKITWDGYREVVLSDGKERRCVRVHRLIMETFEGPCPKGFQVNHRDGDKLNNAHGNLEYVTSTENTHHAYKTGLHKTKTLCNLSYLDFSKMLDMYNCGFPYSEICDYFDLDIKRKDYLGEVLSGNKLSTITGFKKDMRIVGQTASKVFSGEDVDKIKRLRSEGKKYLEIQKEVPMSIAQISRILNGVRRKSHV